MKRINQKGFTLLEIVIYMGLLTLVISGALMATYELLRSQTSLGNEVLIGSEGDFLIKKIEWTLGEISQVNYPSPGSSGNYLSINKLDYSQNPIVIDQFNGAMRIKKGSGDFVVISNSWVNVSSLSFQFNHVPNLSAADNISVSFYLSGQYFQINKVISIIGVQ